MTITDKQILFLHNEFGIDNFNPAQMSPLDMWRLREHLIDYECGDDADDEQIDIAANLVDYISSIIPDDWRRKTPLEVAAMHPGAVSKITYSSKKVAV